LPPLVPDGEQGLHGDDALPPRPPAGEQGLQGLWPRCAICCMGDAATGVGAAAVTPTAAAMVDRLPARSAVLIRLDCMGKRLLSKDAGWGF